MRKKEISQMMRDSCITLFFFHIIFFERENWAAAVFLLLCIYVQLCTKVPPSKRGGENGMRRCGLNSLGDGCCSVISAGFPLFGRWFVPSRNIFKKERGPTNCLCSSRRKRGGSSFDYYRTL